MNLHLVSTANGFHDFDVSGAGSIHRVTVSEKIKRGNMFNIYYGDGHYVKHQKTSGKWLGTKGIAGYLVGDLEKSIRATDLFVGEGMDSEKFYHAVAEMYSDCDCVNPVFKSGASKRVVAVDLDHPDQVRQSSRYIVFLGKCSCCAKDTTVGTGLGSFNQIGLDNLKRLAEKKNGSKINWSGVVTSFAEMAK